ncbi:MAG: DmsC/YnfH family molybdoenzyme membrane anchor subunit [Dokdonella sp.]
MRPTFSIILFTVLSGAGYGLLFLLGLDLASGTPSEIFVVRGAGGSSIAIDPRYGLGVALAAGFILTSCGLLASVAHLGQPWRAWRAFSQWRSSWLSREGVASLLTYIPTTAIAILLFARPDAHTALRLCGAALALGCVATVFCTARIYSSLQTIRAWHTRYTAAVYLMLGLFSGALSFTTVHVVTIANGGLWLSARWVAFGAVLLGPACALLKLLYWRHIDARPSVNAGHATGLDRIGDVRSFEQPHTEENYLTHEMGFVLARKHSRRLRSIAFWLLLLAPIAVLPLNARIGLPIAWLLCMAGIFVERWLFFAEAKHAVMAYYGR